MSDSENTAKTQPVILSVGLSLGDVAFTIDRAAVNSYVKSVEDRTGLYGREGFVPPLAVAAIAKKRLMESLHIPDGAIQSQAVFDFKGVVKSGEALHCSGVVSEHWKRNGVNYVAVDIRVTGMKGKCILKGKMGFILAPSAAGGHQA
jgi:hypothetical protein